MRQTRGRYVGTSNEAKGLTYIITQALLTVIFQGEAKRLDKEMTRLAKRNKEMNPEATDGFVHRMRYFSTLPPDQRKDGGRAVPHPHLVEELERFHADWKKLDDDRVKITQGLSLLLRDCKVAQDFRDALPNSMASVLDQTKNLQRQRPEAFMFKEGSVQHSYYLQIRDLMEFYMMTKAMY